MTTTTVALAAGLALCLLAVVALCLLVVVLRREVRRLSRRLDESQRQATASVPEPGYEPTPAAATSGELAVPVITALPADRREVESAPSGWRIASVSLAEPLIKIASFSYGVRRALDEERRLRYRLAIRKELRRQRKLRRQRRLRPVHQGWRS